MNIGKLWDFAIDGPWETIDEKTSTEWKHAVEGDTLWVSFKHTTSGLDWLLNFLFFIVPVGFAGLAVLLAVLAPFFIPAALALPAAVILAVTRRTKGGYSWFIHLGIWLKWRAVEEPFKQLVQRALYSGISKIILTGHSQGGGMVIRAHKCLADYLVVGGITYESYTFGSMRALWWWNRWRFKGEFKTLTQYRARKDLVWRLPPKWMGYADVGNIVMVGPRGFPWPWLTEKAHTGYGDYGYSFNGKNPALPDNV